MGKVMDNLGKDVARKIPYAAPADGLCKNQGHVCPGTLPAQRRRMPSLDANLTTIVVVPTYNERDNVESIVTRLMECQGVGVLVVDDGSPDGTGEIADTLAARHAGRVEVLHRTGVRGLGRSYIAGMQVALQRGAPFIVQMDADWSHDPAYLPELVAAASAGDLVIGSRYVQGVSVVNWPLRRILLSTFANRYVREIIGLAVHDCTAGYRCWRRDALARLPLSTLASEGYAFQVEMLFEADAAGCKISEVPIIFVERRAGASKVSTRVMLESLITPWRLLGRRLARQLHLARHPSAQLATK